MMMLASAILALAASAVGEEKPGHELLFADIPAPVCWSQTDCEPAVKVFKDGTVMLGFYHFFLGGVTNTLMGIYNKVMGGSVHTAMGMWNTVMAGMAHTAMGWNNTIMGGTAMTVMGYKTVAVGGTAATATGYATTALGMASLSTGYKTGAFAMAVSMGNGTFAKGIGSVAMGHKTTAESFAEVVIGQFNELNPIGECDQWIPTFDNPEPGPAPEGCASRGTPFCLEGGECDVGNDTAPVIATVLPAWQASNAVFRVGVGTGESDRKDAITVYKNGTVFIGDLVTLVDVPGRRLSASDGALEKKLEATEKKLAALEASYTKELAALKAAVAALTRNP